MAKKKENLIEVCRSFSQKVQNPKSRYENVDFFASAKREVSLEEFEETSMELSSLVKKEVDRAVAEYREGFDREVTYEPLPQKPPTEEEAMRLDEEVERIRAEGISEQEKAKLKEAEN